MGAYDREESEEQLQQGVYIINRARKRFRELPELLPEPEVMSMLSIERAYTPRGSSDIFVAFHRHRACENLERIFDIMTDREDSGGLLVYPFSIYSLIRSAIEAAAVAMWLIKPSKKAQRIFRALQVSYSDTCEVYNFYKFIYGKDAAERAKAEKHEILNRLNELKDAVGPLRQRELSPPPKYTAILKEVSPPPHGASSKGYGANPSPLVIWKIASTFLHGSSEQLIRSLSDIRQVTEFNDGAASFEIRASIQLIAASIHGIVDLISDLDERYIYLGRVS